MCWMFMSFATRGGTARDANAPRKISENCESRPPMPSDAMSKSALNRLDTAFCPLIFRKDCADSNVKPVSGVSSAHTQLGSPCAVIASTCTHT